MKRLTVLLILMLIAVGCESESLSCTGTVVHKEYQESTWGVGIGQTGKGTIGPVAVLLPEQYLITIRISNQKETFSIEQDIYEQINVGDTIACEYVSNFFTCDFGEN